MSKAERMQRPKPMAAGHRRRYRKKRHRCGCGNTEDYLFDSHHGSLLTFKDQSNMAPEYLQY